MKILDAVEQVLTETGAPLHYEAITKQVLEKGLWTATGKTPEATINARLAVQVKRWQANVQSPVVQQVRGSLGAHEQGLIITTSDFAKGAIEEANRADATPVALMNGEQLVKLLVENDIGIRRTPADLIELGEGEDEV